MITFKYKILCIVWFFTLVIGVTPTAHAEFLRIGVFNMNNPGLSELKWDQRMDALRRWGSQLFSKADIVILSELGTPSQWPWDWWNNVYLNTMAEASGLVYRQAAWLAREPTWPDVGIISKYPIRKWEVHDLYPAPARILDVTIENSRGRLLRVLGTHSVSTDDKAHPSPRRIESARKVHELVVGTSVPTFFLGGDLNTCPPVPPGQESGPLQNECGGLPADGVEYTMLSQDLTDSFRAIPGSVHCSDGRIDYLFFRGPYKVVAYETCSFGTTGEPSDHPFVLVTLELIDAPQPPQSPTPSQEQCLQDCKADRDACMDEVGTPGAALARQCAQQYLTCVARCRR